MATPITPASNNGKVPDASRPATLRAEIHQATGIVSVQLGVTLTAALAHLQGYADTHHRPLADIAADVVAFRLKFDPEP